MKTKREMPFSEALEEISSAVQRLKKEGAARVNGYEVTLDDPVMLEIETEAEKGKAEIEFEIKWPASGAKSKAKGKREGSRRGRGRLLLGAVAGVVLGAALLMTLRRLRTDSGEDDE